MSASFVFGPIKSCIATQAKAEVFTDLGFFVFGPPCRLRIVEASRAPIGVTTPLVSAMAQILDRCSRNRGCAAGCCTIAVFYLSTLIDKHPNTDQPVCSTPILRH